MVIVHLVALKIAQKSVPSKTYARTHPFTLLKDLALNAAVSGGLLNSIGFACQVESRGASAEASVSACENAMFEHVVRPSGIPHAKAMSNSEGRHV